MLYHVSGIHNLKVLKPKISTHGKAYVYAIGDIVTGLLFGAKKDDFDFILYVNEDGKPEVYECWKNAFEEIYKGVSCSVYEVDEAGFLRGITGWNAEYVNENEVEVLAETVIDDLHIRLCEEEKKGNLIVHRFEDTEQYKAIISNHIVDRLIRFGILDRPNIDEKLIKHYGRMIEVLKELISGTYL